MKRVIKLILLIIWMFIIFSFSSDTGKVSSSKSDGLIINTIEAIFNRSLTSKEKEMYLDIYVHYVRKAAHIFIFLVLGVLIFSNLCEYKSFSYKLCLISLFLAFLYASFDEIHQVFVDGRSGEVKDVLIDTFGSFIGVNTYYLIRRKKDE